MDFFFGLFSVYFFSLANARTATTLTPTAYPLYPEFDNCGFHLNATCDDKMKLFADGELLATSEDWKNTSVVYIPPNTGEIEIRCIDGWILGGILASSENGLITNNAWNCSSDNGTTWNYAHELGANGVTSEDISPDAKWIWTDRPTWTHTKQKRHTTAICTIQLPNKCGTTPTPTPSTTTPCTECVPCLFSGTTPTLTPTTTTTPTPTTPEPTPGFNLNATCNNKMELFVDRNLLATSYNWRDTSQVHIPARTQTIEIHCSDSCWLIEGILASSDNGLITDNSWNCSSDNGITWSSAHEIVPNGLSVPDISPDAKWISTGQNTWKDGGKVICKVMLDVSAATTSTTKEPELNGYCLTSGGHDQNSGTQTLKTGDKDSCYHQCKAVPRATGCEWHKKGFCIYHTLDVATGNGNSDYKCWVFNSGIQPESTTPVSTGCLYTDKYVECPQFKNQCKTGNFVDCMNRDCAKTCKCGPQLEDLSPWSSWSSCSSTCGIAAKTRTRTCPKLPCRPGITEETASCHLPSCGPYIQQKCFLEDSNITFLDLGHNHMNQDLKPVWKIADKGRSLTEALNTRPSIGLSNLGDVTEPVSFSGRVFSASGDDDVIGMVFGFWNEANFFVIASARQHPGPTNWYVARLHATCGSSCTATTTISDAIWDPQSHPEDITVLATGSTYWQHGNEYNFTVSFNPSDLLLLASVTNENQVEPILETGIISAKTNDSGVDAVSRKGGFVGVYVDSQAHTTWDYLVCQDSHVIAPTPDDSPTLIHTDSIFKYYKVSVPESSKMTSETILSACARHGMKPQCAGTGNKGWVYADSNCIRVKDCENIDGCARVLSNLLCSTSDPKKCPTTLNMFWPMYKWGYGSACGVTKERYCGLNNNYTSTSNKPYFAACIKLKDWTIIQRRGEYGNAEDYFYKDFNEYENGFGSVDDELWIGLKNLTALTKDGEWELRVDLTDWDNKTYHAKYGTFSVGPAPTYKLHVEGFDDGNSTLGDSMAYHNGQSFSARNNDQDSWGGNCAVSFRGGWWYNGCHHSNLNGVNYAKQVHDGKGINWFHGKARGSTLTWKASLMKIRKVQEKQQRQRNFPRTRQQLSEAEGSNVPSLQKQLEQESSHIPSSQKLPILNLPEQLEQEAPKIPSLQKQPNEATPKAASLPVQPEQGDLGILSLPGQHTQEAPKLQSLTEQSGMKIEFQLKGKIGIEKVKISVDGNEEEIGLTTEWRLFSYPRSTTEFFSVEFLNDIGYTDVFIRGHESQVTDLLPNFPANKFLGCGTKNEDEKCVLLRIGTLMWNGKYTYNLKDTTSTTTTTPTKTVLVIGPVPWITVNVEDFSIIPSNSSIPEPGLDFPFEVNGQYTVSKVINGIMYVCNSYIYSRWCISYNGSGLQWKLEGNEMRLMTPRSTPADTLSPGDQPRWIVQGGVDLFHSVTVDVWTPESGKWKKDTNYTSPQSNDIGCIVVIEGKILQVGGRIMNSRGKVRYTNRVFLGDTEVTSMKEPRIYIDCALFENRVWVTGFAGSFGSLSHTVEIYDYKTDIWTSGPRIPPNESNNFSGKLRVIKGDLHFICKLCGKIFKLINNKEVYSWEEVADIPKHSGYIAEVMEIDL